MAYAVSYFIFQSYDRMQLALTDTKILPEVWKLFHLPDAAVSVAEKFLVTTSISSDSSVQQLHE